jgi:predicted amidohydrolase
MTTSWKIAAVQMDCRLGGNAANLESIRAKLRKAAGDGARLVVFPECILSGYGFTSRGAVVSVAEELPGPSVNAIAEDCAELGVYCVFGLFEKAGGKVFNACALVGPKGFIAGYRKTHLPCLGADRFTDPGDRPFAVHDLGGLKLGMTICFDGSFPETARVLTLLGADLIVLPTNWAEQAMRMATLVPRCRAFENHVYYLAVNRIGNESGFQYIGHSSICDFRGDHLGFADHPNDAILSAEIDPAAARSKRVVTCAGEYEIDRVNWRRPDLYGELVKGDVFAGHSDRE